MIELKIDITTQTFFTFTSEATFNNALLLRYSKSPCNSLEERRKRPMEG
jgi:hypothetical protein